MPLVAAKSYVAMANVSNIKCDGEVIKGLQSIDWKIVKRRSNVHNIGIHERIGIDYGDMYVTGILRVRSAFPKFDKSMGEEKPFQLVAELKDQKEAMGKISFDECYIDSKTFTMEVNGAAISEYAFTATRVRQSIGDTEVDFGKIPGL
jgi:hypothetical protein